MRVVEQVHQDPPDGVRIAGRPEPIVDLRLDRSIRHTEVAGDGARQLGDVDGDRDDRRDVLLEPSGDQQFLDERREVLSVALDDLEELRRLDRRLRLLAGLGRGQHDREWRSELVRHEAEELGLQAVELDELDDVGALGVE